MRKEIYVKDAPKPKGHYCHAYRAGDFVYISGQLPADIYTGEKVQGDLKSQAEKIFENLDIILENIGGNKKDVVKSTVYIPDVTLWGEINEHYKDYFKDHRPSRSIVPTRELHHGVLVEMEFVVYLGE